MALPVPPINPNTPIQNNPFYYPETNYLKGEYGPFIVGSGFSINNSTGTIDVSSGGGGPTILAGVGIAVTTGTGTVTITNTGIRTVTAGAGISVSVAGGNLNIINTQPSPPPSTLGTVTSVLTGTGLTGGPITTSGTIALETVGTVSPGTYNNATITVDAYGRVTYAAPGSGTGSAIYATAPLAVTPTFPQTISIQAASTASSGAVQLNTSTSSTSTTQAATPSAVKQAYDLGSTAASNAATALSTATGASAAASTAQATANSAQSAATAAQTAATSAQGTASAAATSAAAAQAIASAAIPCSSFTAKGQLLAATGPSTFNALPPGTNGQVLIACSSCTSGLTWSSQPIAVGTVTSVGTGIGLLGGPITSTGTISLAPTAVTPGTYTYTNITVDTYGRITAAGNGVPPIPCAAITGKGVVLTGTAANAPTALPSGPNGYVLTACSACATGLTWAVAASSGIPTSAITSKGALITGTAANTVSTLPVGSDNFVLTADSACADGIKWAAAAAPTTPATPSTEGVVYASTKNSASFATALGFNALNTTVTGVGNVALGSSAGCSLTSGQFNTFVGSGAGCANTTGLNNIALGSQALNAQVSGNCNIAIGNLAGISLTTECGNVIVGPHPGVAGCDNNVYIADGTGTLRVRVNENGAIAIGGSGYGSANQVLTSAGTTGSPTWTTIVSTGGTVTSITPGTGLCASSNPITVSGTICLTDTGVTAASYTNASITVDAQGRLTAASSGTAPVTAITGTAPIDVTTGTTPVVSICSASTTALGAVQLTNALNSTSETLALTACAGQCLQSQITALSVSGTVELAGTIDASTGFVASITSVGSADGYTVGAVLPAASATTVNTYVIVTTPGTMTPPGGSATAATRGDWFLVSETSPGVYDWTFLNVGFDAPAATTTVAGIVCLSTNALAQAGTDTTTALTPAAAASAFIPNGCITAKGSLISGTAACSPTALTVGSNGQFLAANSACSSGLEWVTGCFIPCSCITAKGTIITGTAANTPTALPVGLDGQYLVANTACSTGLEWVTGMGDTPVGAVNWFSATTAPLGWLVADGRAVSRTTYAALFAVVGTTYGTGDGSTTFNLPDLRGQFIRGWDAAGGTARGCDPGRVFGSNQGFALQNHCHNVEVVSGAAGRPEWACPNNACPAGASYPNASAGGAVRTAGFTSTIGSTETRPTNVALLPCIKWQVTTAPSSCGIPCACITAKGALITGTAADTPVALPVGTNGQTLIACSACASGLTWATPNVNPQKAVNRSSAVTLATEITTNSMVTGDSLTIFNNNTATPPASITITATTLANYQSYPTQATATVFTLPPQGTVTLILSDSATNSWYIESFDTPGQVGTVAFKAYNPAGTVPTLLGSITIGAIPWSIVQFPATGMVYNGNGYYNNTTGRFQPLVAGYYHVIGRTSAISPAFNQVGIIKNGTEQVAYNVNENNNPATETSTVVYLNGTTDYIQMGTAWASGGSFRSYAGANEFSATLVNQTNTRVVGIDAVASMVVTAGTIPNIAGIAEVIPGTNGVTVAEDFDPQSWFDTATGKFTPTIPGYYQVNVVVTSNNSSTNTWGGFFKNGAVFGQAIQTLTSSPGNWNTATYSAVVFLNGTTDYLRMGAGMQGGTAGFATNTGVNRMSISLVGANQATPIPPMTWINAGTVQSVGLGAVVSGTLTPGTAPTITASTQNNVRYRQIGPKEWEVQAILFFTGGTAGSGDLVFTLPGGLQFDLTSPYQLPYTAAPNFAAGWYAFGLPDAWVEFSQNGAITNGQSLIMPLDATRYRIVPVGPDLDKFWNSVYYAIGNYNGYRKWSFTFFTP